MFPMSTTTSTNPNQIFEKIEQAAQAQSKFLKLQPGQTAVLKFDVNRIKLVDREINGKKNKAVEYVVVNVNDGQEKIFTLSLSWALNLNELLKAGYTSVKVSRRGSGLDTSYNFVPV